MSDNPFNTRHTFNLASGKAGSSIRCPHWKPPESATSRACRFSIRIVLEAVLRNCDGKKVTEQHIRQLANWQANAPRSEEIPFVVARIVLQDFTGVPLLVDLAAMRDAAASMGKDPKIIEPLVPVDMVVDHSVQVDYYNRPDALKLNMEMEFERNNERYRFMKWGMQAFNTFKVVPPGIRHRASGQSGISGTRRAAQRWTVLPGHPGRHGQPHHHDQRHRRGRLGRGRH